MGCTQASNVMMTPSTEWAPPDWKTNSYLNLIILNYNTKRIRNLNGQIINGLLASKTQVWALMRVQHKVVNIYTSALQSPRYGLVSDNVKKKIQWSTRKRNAITLWSPAVHDESPIGRRSLLLVFTEEQDKNISFSCANVYAIYRHYSWVVPGDMFVSPVQILSIG